MNKIIKLKYDYKNIGMPNKAIVAIHGWGGDSSSMLPLIDIMDIDDCKWFFPEATYDKEGGGKSWTYQKKDGSYERDKPVEAMKYFINNEVLSSFKSNDVYIIGFSQGALMCYESILKMNVEYGGVFPISGFIVEAEKKHISYPNSGIKNTPIVIGHGKEDDIVKPELSKKAFDIINNANFNVELSLYRGGHKIGMGYLRKIKSIINKKK